VGRERKRGSGGFESSFVGADYTDHRGTEQYILSVDDCLRAVGQVYHGHEVQVRMGVGTSTSYPVDACACHDTKAPAAGTSAQSTLGWYPRDPHYIAPAWLSTLCH